MAFGGRVFGRIRAQTVAFDLLDGEASIYGRDSISFTRGGRGLASCRTEAAMARPLPAPVLVDARRARARRKWRLTRLQGVHSLPARCWRQSVGSSQWASRTGMIGRPVKRSCAQSAGLKKPVVGQRASGARRQGQAKIAEAIAFLRGIAGAGLQQKRYPAQFVKVPISPYRSALRPPQKWHLARSVQFRPAVLGVLATRWLYLALALRTSLRNAIGAAAFANCGTRDGGSHD